MSASLFGKLALVTGGGSGIGSAICRTLARDGAKVIAADINLQAAKNTISKLQTDSCAVEIDVSSNSSITKALGIILERYKIPPSIIINSAGIIRDGYLLKMTEDDFDDVYKVNLKGTFLITQHFAKAIIEHNIKNGTIINFSSIVAKINSVGQTNYAASKSGVVSLTKVASKEFGKFNIRVNAILPGFIDTPMVASIPEKTREWAVKSCPMGRIGRPEEVAEVVSFLASEKSSYVNGALIEVTGGLS